MIRGFYTALSGVMAAMTRQAVVADNIANVNTVGFKQSRTQQTDYELSIMNAVGPELGLLGSGTTPTDLKLDISQGPIQVTGLQTDLAIEGDGLFVVRKDGGIAYSRAGNFLTDATGTLVTEQGYPVLDVAGHNIKPGQPFTRGDSPGREPLRRRGQSPARLGQDRPGHARGQQHGHVRGHDRDDHAAARLPDERPGALDSGQHHRRRVAAG